MNVLLKFLAGLLVIIALLANDQGVIDGWLFFLSCLLGIIVLVFTSSRFKIIRKD